MSNHQRVLLRAILLAVGPAASFACGGSTETSTPSAAGAGGSSHAGGSSAGTGVAGSSTTGGSTNTSGASGANAFSCNNPEPIFVGGKDTGVERCADGSLHKKTKGVCPSVVPSETACSPKGECEFDKECTAKNHGFCAKGFDFKGPHCSCKYGCLTDSDCNSGEICLCGNPIGLCVPGTCSSDADCPAGNQCRTYDQSLGCGFTQTACQTASDECGGDKDCKQGFYCYPDSKTGVRKCVPGGCSIGRPLVVGNAVRVAKLITREDWT